MSNFIEDTLPEPISTPIVLLPGTPKYANTNEEFARTDRIFNELCNLVGVTPSRRQASRFRNNTGSARSYARLSGALEQRILSAEKNHERAKTAHGVAVDNVKHPDFRELHKEMEGAEEAEVGEAEEALLKKFQEELIRCLAELHISVTKVTEAQEYRDKMIKYAAR